MDTLTLLLVLVALLFIGQLINREYFVDGDISNAKVTMSLSDLLYFSANKDRGGWSGSAAGSGGLGYNGRYSGPWNEDDEYGMGSGAGSGSGSGSLDSYLFLKNEMTKQFKDRLKRSSTSPVNLTNIEPSILQGSSYMETVPLKVPAQCS